MFNIFEDLYKDDDSINNVKKIMYDNKAIVSMISGSGPSVFGVFPSYFYAEDAQIEFAKIGIKSYICRAINKEYVEMNEREDPW